VSDRQRQPTDAPVTRDEGTNGPRNYEVTVVGASVNGSILSEATDLPGGVAVAIDEKNKVVLVIPVEAPDARTALAGARELANDFFRVVATSHAAYRRDVDDERDDIRRTDAVFIADGPPPPLDVAEGGVTEVGVTLLDADEQVRRQGRIVRIRAQAMVTHPMAADARRTGGRHVWSHRVRNALSLYWAAQCTVDHEVRFVLAMAALEVLAQPPKKALLEARLDSSERGKLLARLSAVLTQAGLSTQDRDRLLNRLAETQEVGMVSAFVDYLNSNIAAGTRKEGLQVDGREIRRWIKQRGSFLHAGLLSKDEEEGRNRLIAIVGTALRAELDALI
jgi:hypothetical protein